MDGATRELIAVSVLAACTAGAAWYVDAPFFILVFLFASAFAAAAAVRRNYPRQ